MKPKKIMVVGCAGKMGQVLTRHILSKDSYQLVGAVDPRETGKKLATLLTDVKTDLTIFPTIKDALSAISTVDLAIDFTTPDVAFDNALVSLKAKIPIIIGTTGIPSQKHSELDSLAKEMNTPVMIVPNFAIGAVLMLEFSKMAAKFMKKAEVIEMHHPQKLDKPSGTALLTKKLIEDAQLGSSDEVLVHSVRLPGLVAHQSVIFGDLGQTLTITHDSLSRDSFMPGVDIAISQMGSFIGLRVGLKLE